MIPNRIKTNIESSPHFLEVNGISSDSKDWKHFTRTTFEKIARKINQKVSQLVIESPFLVQDFLLFGENEFENICFKHKIANPDDFIGVLKSMNHQRPYNWISGKTLQGYWNNSNAKDKKLNVLLTFLEVDLEEWDQWKNDTLTVETKQESNSKAQYNSTLLLLRKHFVGHYYRYYQKTDKSPVLIKTPFVIKAHEEEIVSVNTKTLGHRYKSSYMIIRDGALYIECENLDWNEKESFIFNIGFETNPQIITGVSNTLNRRGQAIAIKNVLVKASFPYDYHQAEGIEIPYDGHPLDPDGVDSKILHFFKRNSDNVITTNFCYSLDELSFYGQSRIAGIY